MPLWKNLQNIHEYQNLFSFSGEDEESVEDTERAKLLAEKLREMIREGNFIILGFSNFS